jgi:hypothetical protein
MFDVSDCVGEADEAPEFEGLEAGNAANEVLSFAAGKGSGGSD